MTNGTTFDVLVLGAGFAGITAARGVKNAGLSVAVLEARDRIGGRVWTSELDGTKIEYGASWIHWFQPFVWTEFMRSGLQLHEDPWFPPITIHDKGQAKPLDFDLYRQMLNDGWHAFAKTSQNGHLMERPFHPEQLTSAETLDAMSVQDAIDNLDIDDETKVALVSEISVQMNADPKDVSYLSQLRWWSASGWDLSLMIDCLARYKIESGLSSLIHHIATAANLDVRLEKVVSEVIQNTDGVSVVTRCGDMYNAKKIVCALPMNCIKDVKFDPPLTGEKMNLSKEEHAAKGIKILFKTKGEKMGHAIIAGPDEKPINLLNPIRIDGDERLYVGFGIDSGAFDPNDLHEVNAILSDLHPDLKATACAGYDWNNDEFSRGTWHMPRPTQNTRTLHAFKTPDGHIHFAGDYLGTGWVGFVDGAIESGTLVADEVLQYLVEK